MDLTSENKAHNALALFARVESRTVQHSRIGVFQNGGKAGVLTVEAEHEQDVIHAIVHGVNAVAVRDLLEECLHRFHKYEMDVDVDPTSDHLAFMTRLENAIRNAKPGGQ